MISLMNKMGEKKREKMLNLDHKLLGALKEDGVDQNVVNEELNSLDDADQFTQAKSFRKKLEHYLHATPLEIFLVVLVVVDVIILLSMLLIDLNVLQLKLEDMNHGAEYMVKAINKVCDNPSVSHFHGTDLTKLAKYFKRDGCPSPNNHTSNSTETAGSPEDDHQRVKRAAAAGDSSNPTVILLLEIGHILHILSITILAVMFVEVLLKIFAMGKKYFNGKLEVVDGVIIFVSFALDIYFTDGIGPKGDKNNAATILVVLLMWRIVRVFNALLVTAKKRLEFRIRVQKRMRKLLDDKVSSHQNEIKTLENHIGNLERMAKRYEILDYEIVACKPLARAVKKPSTSAGLASMMQMSMGLMKGLNSMSERNQSSSTASNNSSGEDLECQISMELDPENNITRIVEEAILPAKEHQTPENPSQPCIDFVKAVSTGKSAANGTNSTVPSAIKLATAFAIGPIKEEKTDEAQDDTTPSVEVKSLPPKSSKNDGQHANRANLPNGVTEEEFSSEHENETIPLLDFQGPSPKTITPKQE